MSRKVVAIDLDDVTVDFNTAFAVWHNKKYGTSICYTDITTFNLLKVYNLSREEFNHRTWEFLHHHHSTMPLIAGAKVGLTQLHAWDVKPHIVTSRWDTLTQITQTYLEQELFDLIEEVHFANSHFEHHGSKVEICQYINAIAHIEDALHHAEQVSAAGITALLHDKPWNQSSQMSAENLVRCGRWSESDSGWEVSLAWIERHVL